MNLKDDFWVVVDSIRIREQLETIREVYGTSVFHFHLTASISLLEERFNNRVQQGEEKAIKYSELMKNATEKQIGDLAEFADLLINTEVSSIQEVLFTATKYLDSHPVELP